MQYKPRVGEGVGDTVGNTADDAVGERIKMMNSLWQYHDYENTTNLLILKVQ